jgi:glycosyltransferase involved in cell wall biosynthesis
MTAVPAGGRATRELSESELARPHVVHVITGLMTGGAEVMLHKLLVQMRDGPLRHSVISLYGGGPIADAIAVLGIPVHSLGLRRGSGLPAAFLRLRRALRERKPDLLQGWMYHGNVAASLVRPFAAPGVPVLWNVRQNLTDIRLEKRTTAAVIRLGAILSRHSPAHIIYNARTSAERHEAFGYDVRRRRLIANGFDLQRFAPHPGARERSRARLGVAADAFLIGAVGRHHAVKGHEVFLAAAARFAARWPEARFAMIGRDVDVAPALTELIARHGMGDRVIRLGERMDIDELVPGFDVSGISSVFGEGFPNVVGEAMAAGVPCVVTDVGDSAWVVGDTGLVVPPGDADALAAAWERLRELGEEDRRALGQRARERIRQHFSISGIAAEYEALYRSLLVPRRSPAPRGVA